jgi:S-DNA-T family DNA segregation ATPase FtsK/SpoIIIE
MEEFVGITAKLYNKLMRSGKNILIAGTTGSGKSTMLDGIINSILYEDAAEHQLVLIDLKRVTLGKYSNTAHCIGFAKKDSDVPWLLDGLRKIIDKRLDSMDGRGIELWDGATIHLCIDEMAELMLNDKEVANKLQSICQIGRAAGVQVICATQCPLTTVIPTRIKVNFPIVVGLHTVSARHSRNILEVSGCEGLRMPDAKNNISGEALILYPPFELERVTVPKIPEDSLETIIKRNQRV